MSEKITFSNGKTETVHTVPQYMLALIDALPEFQVDENDTVDMVIAKQASCEKRKQDAAWLYAFKDIDVPPSWSFPVAAANAGITPREGVIGRKIDYIQLGVLLTADDNLKAQRVMWALGEEEVSAASSTFRPSRLARWIKRLFRR